MPPWLVIPALAATVAVPMNVSAQRRESIGACF
jgi:hypothetical protein